MYYRYLNLPFKIKQPDRSLIDEFTGSDVLGFCENDNFTIMNLEKNLKSYRNTSYDKKIKLEKKIKFDFQYDFEKWFNNYTDKVKLGSYYLLQTKDGIANTIHSDTKLDQSKTKINFVFADYNSSLEYFEANDFYRYKHGDHKNSDNDLLCADEKDCIVIEKIKYENYYPILLDTNIFHRGNNRNCKNRRLTISYDLNFRNGNAVDFTEAVNVFRDVLVPVENKFYMLSDF
tara:strand:- start:1012 stop:1704 length:693 start_codon:yes stop_codon:yes gene_type:complete